MVTETVMVMATKAMLATRKYATSIVMGGVLEGSNIFSNLGIPDWLGILLAGGLAAIATAVSNSLYQRSNSIRESYQQILDTCRDLRAELREEVRSLHTEINYLRKENKELKSELSDKEQT